MKIAFSMYSRIPMPRSQWTEESMAYAMCFFPWIGGVIGALTWGIFSLKEMLYSRGIHFGELFFTVLLVLTPILVTGGIHLDGFLDTQDALRSYQPQKRRLQILKDPHAGAFSVIACGVYLLAYVGVYSSLTLKSVRVISLTFMLSRTLSALSVICFPQAREEGMVATFSRNTANKATKFVLSFYLAALCIGILYVGKVSGIAALTAAGLMFLYYYRMSLKKFGGITGDLAGYFLQMCELFMAAAIVTVDILSEVRWLSPL